MKIIFDRDLPTRKITKDKVYPVLSFNENTAHSSISYVILNNEKHLALINISNSNKSEIIDSEIFLNTPLDEEFRVKEVEADVKDFVINLFKGSNDYYLEDLLLHKPWAVTRFVKKIEHTHFDINTDYRSIASSDLSKIAYINGTVEALFQGICNYFGGCANFQFRAIFDKHSIQYTNLIHIANSTIGKKENHIQNESDLPKIDNWEEELKNKLYNSIFSTSDLGSFSKQYLPNYKEYDNCIKKTIDKIVLTIDSILINESPEIFFIPEARFYMSDYCFLFKTNQFVYRFYLGYSD